MTNKEIREALAGSHKEALEIMLKHLKNPKYRYIVMMELAKAVKKGNTKEKKKML